MIPMLSSNMGLDILQLRSGWNRKDRLCVPRCSGLFFRTSLKVETHLHLMQTADKLEGYAPIANDQDFPAACQLLCKFCDRVPVSKNFDPRTVAARNFLCPSHLLSRVCPTEASGAA